MIDPPCNLNAERATLGGIFLSPLVLDRLLTEEHLRVDSFYSPRHQLVFAAMLRLYDQQRGIDTLTVISELGPQLEQAGGDGEVHTLAVHVPAAGNTAEYARLVVTEARWRRRLNTIHQAIAAIAERDEPGFLAALTEPDEHHSDEVDDAQEIVDFLEGGGGNAVSTPWPKLNELLCGGGQVGDVTFISGWTNFGKSWCAIQWLAHAAEHGHHARMYSNELTRLLVNLRTVMQLTGVPLSRMMQPKQLTEDDKRRVLATAPRLPFRTEECAGWTAEMIARDLRRRRPQIACVDRVDLVARPPGVFGTQGIDHVSHVLNTAAKQAQCHLILVGQLNQARSVSEERPKPVLRDIRETGELSNSAANVMFVHRDQDEVTVVGGGRREFMILDSGRLYLEKVKTGSLGGVDVVFDSRTRRFLERSRLEVVA